MKKLVVLAVVAALFGACGTAQAAKVWDDMSWWGNTGATKAPVADSKGRSGYWWWPTEAASNANDSELWGNRGIVYAQWTPKEETKDVVPPPPPEPPKVETHQVPVLSNVLFDFDKSVVKPEAKATVDAAVKELVDYPKETLVIEGHTCNIGEEAYNQGLGQRRADAVKAVMVQSGIDAARITTVSFGETQPAVPNDTPDNRKLNRRAVFKFTLNP